jgi:hypothetical protein
MNDVVNPYEVSAAVRYTLAGIVILGGLWIALKSMEKEREKLLEGFPDKKGKYLQNKKRHSDERSLLSRPVDEFFTLFFRWAEEKCYSVRVRILMLSYWGRVAVLVVTMAFYCCILLYFKLDETSMKKERKAVYEQMKNAVRKKLGMTEE